MKKTILFVAVLFLGILTYSQEKEDVYIIMKNDKIVFNGTCFEAKPVVDNYIKWCKDKKVRQLVSSSYHPDSLSAAEYVLNAQRLRSMEGGHKVFSRFETEIFFDKETEGWYVKFFQESKLNPKIDSKDGWLDWLK